MRRFLILIALITALALPAQAVANGVPSNASGATQYHRVTPTVEPPTTPGQLPFTGEDVLLVVLAGVLLTGTGLTLYRQVKHR
jgi:uncharacterized surface anchored protein